MWEPRPPGRGDSSLTTALRMCPKPSPSCIPIPDFVPSACSPRCALPLTALTWLSLWRMGASCSYQKGERGPRDLVKMPRLVQQTSLREAASVPLCGEPWQGLTMNVCLGHVRGVLLPVRPLQCGAAPSARWQNWQVELRDGLSVARLGCSSYCAPHLEQRGYVYQLAGRQPIRVVESVSCGARLAPHFLAGRLGAASSISQVSVRMLGNGKTVVSARSALRRSQ